MVKLAESRLFVKWDKFNREKHKESGEWQRMMKKTKLTQARSTPPCCLQKGNKKENQKNDVLNNDRITEQNKLVGSLNEAQPQGNTHECLAI